MPVTVNAATEDVRTLTTSPQTFSHAGAASGVKGVVLALVHGTSSTDHVTAASYGGVALTRIQRNVDTTTEPGAAELWFLGAGVPQGTQTVSYTPGATTDDFHAVAITLLGADDLEVVAQGGVSDNVADPSVTLAYTGRTCMSFAALYGGGAAPTSFTPNANCATVHDHDLGAFYSEIIRQTTAGSADFAIGGTASSDDVAYAAIAISEIQTATTFFKTLAATAVGVVALGAGTIFLRTLAVTAAGVATLSTALLTAVSMAATAVGVATLSRVATYFRALAVTATGVASLTKKMFVTLSVTAAGVPAMVKKMFKTLSATATGVPALATALLSSVSMAATAVGAATLSAARLIVQVLSATATGVASLTTLLIEGGSSAGKRMKGLFVNIGHFMGLR